MLIDWFTVGAQALNFLVLVALMKHFLYKPILHAVDEREKHVAAALADADEKKAEAEKEKDDLRTKSEKLDQERAALLSKATEEANSERERLIAAARRAADAMSTKRAETLKSDARSLNAAITRRTQDAVFDVARKALRDLATTSLEELISDVFLRRLGELDADTKGRLAQSLGTAEPAVLRSAFELPPERRATLQHALSETFSAEVRVRFEVAPKLIAGIELTSGGQKIGWGLGDYLGSLEKGVAELLTAGTEQDHVVPPTAPDSAVAPAPGETTAAAPPEAATRHA